jgi:hypothetical protein
LEAERIEVDADATTRSTFILGLLHQPRSKAIAP